MSENKPLENEPLVNDDKEIVNSENEPTTADAENSNSETEEEDPGGNHPLKKPPIP